MSVEVLEAIRALALAAPGQAALFLGATAAALALPDVDLFLMRVLHHRSILTHSVLLPFLLLWFVPELGSGAAAGAFLGVAVHLGADLLSPSHGFGRVWWPWPLRASLGRWSGLWLLGNALAASGLAVSLLPGGGDWRTLAGLAGVAAAVGYGLRKERSLLAALVGLGVVAAGHAPGWWMG